jgi:two-component system NarL family response regulator
VTIRIILVDDHQLLREALRDKLEKEVDIEIIGMASDGRAAIELIEASAPDIVLLDIGLPDMSGVEVSAWVNARCPAVKVIALSMYADKRFASEMLKTGARGYVTKTTGGDELLKAIRTVAAGDSYLCHEVAGAIIHTIQEPSILGRREREVLRHLAEGQRSAEIAKQLHIALGTVEVHRRNIMRKLNLHSVAELTKYAIREGITST